MKKYLGFNNVNIYIENRGVVKSSIQFKDGVFTSFEENENLEKLPENLFIVPGFIEEHIHGANGSDFMDGKVESVKNIARSVAQDGTTSLLATTMSMSEKDIFKAVEAINDYIKKRQEYATILGIHLEGPFISKTFCGAQDPINIIEPNIEILKKFVKASNDNVKMITFAPEHADEEFINYLLAENIVPSIGHSNATSEETKCAFKRGVRCATHTYNAMKGIHHRDVGVVGEVFLDDNVKAELICDLHHVSADAIKLLYKCKGKDNVVLITDSMEARFLPNGQYELGGQKVFVKDGVATLANGVLAGSVLHMNEAIRNIKRVLNISFEDAIDMASKNPAINLGIFDRKGSIALGKDADFTIVDKDFNVYATFVKGKLVYKKGENL